MRRLPTYIPGLDSHLGGGPPEGSLIVVVGGPGTGKTLLVLQSLYSAALTGETSIYFTFDETPQNVGWYAESFGWRIGALQKEKKFFIYYLSEQEYERFRPDRLDSLKERLGYVIEATGAQRVAIDSMSMISYYLARSMSLSTELELKAAVQPLVRTLSGLAKKYKLLFYVTMHPDDPARSIYEALSDGVFELRYYKDISGSEQRGIRVPKLRATPHPLGYMGLWIERHGLEIEVI